jgi:putative transposase
MDHGQARTERPSAADRPQESGAAALGRGGRMSRQRKRDAVLRLLRGEDLETVSRSLGVTAATLSGWRDAFLAAGEASLSTPAHRRRGAGERTAQGAAGGDAARAGTARSQDRPAGGASRPFGPTDAEAMSQTTSPSSGKPYGTARVCHVWRLSRATLYRHRRPSASEPPRRRGPIGPMADTGLVAAIRAVLADSPFHGEGHRKVWARLRMRGVRTSRRRVLRLMRQHGLLAPARTGSPRGPRNHDGTIIPDAVDTMWGTDMTTTWTVEGQVAVFIAIDHYSAECVGIHAARRGTRFEALEPIRQGVRRCFGAFGKDVARGLALRHDHGSQYMSDAFQNELTFLGIESSPAFVRAPEGNGCAERFIRTLKENLLWVQTFNTVEDLRRALLEFRQTYNTTWLIERHGFRTPSAIRTQQLSPTALAA